jgi:hypothetical protein
LHQVRRCAYNVGMFPTTTAKNSIPGTSIKIGAWTSLVTGLAAQIAYITKVHGDQPGIYIIAVRVGGNLISDTFHVDELR